MVTVEPLAPDGNAGPDHVYVPVEAGETTLKEILLPLQIGKIAVTDGAFGALGGISEKLKAFDGQAFNVTLILV